MSKSKINKKIIRAYDDRFKLKILKAAVVSLMITTNLSFYSSCGNNISKEILNSITIGEIKCGYDDQIFFYTTHDLVRTEEGYYFINDLSILCFFDIVTQKTIPVCSQPNCLHTVDTTECDANLSLIYKVHGLWFYNNEIYIVSYDSKIFTYYLCSISKDGSKRTRSCNLLSLDPETTEKGASGGDIHNLIIHRGYAYFTIAESETKTSLFQVALNRNAIAKRIYNIDKSSSYIAGLKGYGNGIYFKSSIPVDNSKTDYKTNLYYYDIPSDSLQKYIENKEFDYFPYDGKIFFSTGTELCMFDIIGNTTKTIFQNNFLRRFSFDGKYFYFDNFDVLDKNKERHITVLDINGVLIDTIIINDGFYCVFGDANYMFCYWRIGDSLIIRGFDKKQIGTDSRNWIDLKSDDSD